uniref:ATP synthase F(0) complex subunit f, mitochondrial n=1 Tax=Panthera tigris altaica TaxID=74533 RepID=A0A8C9MAM4_PANTA
MANSRMASSIPVKEKQLMDVNLGELPSWILMHCWSVSRDYYQCYKYVNVKKGAIAGISMVLAAYVLFNYCHCYKELQHEQLSKYH